jgi:hypothetical protein|tara:strand:+ start:385 stop:834 length:450 start_codon:yes stop_codon:yes gene_type:complete
MKNKNYGEVQKCEFLLKLGDNIVCQRYFTVRDFNKDASQSIDLHDTVTEIMEELKEDLKYRTLILLDSTFNDKNIDYVNFNKCMDHFIISIKCGTKEVYARAMCADIYPPKVRFSVDVRPKMSRMLRELTEVLSQQKVTCKYQDYALNV